MREFLFSFDGKLEDIRGDEVSKPHTNYRELLGLSPRDKLEVHHKDKNRRNNLDCNLEILTIVEHKKEHSKYKNVDWYKLYDEYKNGKSPKQLSILYQISKSAIVRSFKTRGFRMRTQSEANSLDWHNKRK